MAITPIRGGKNAVIAGGLPVEVLATSPPPGSRPDDADGADDEADREHQPYRCRKQLGQGRTGDGKHR
jgi:hypothetical protein